MMNVIRNSHRDAALCCQSVVINRTSCLNQLITSKYSISSSTAPDAYGVAVVEDGAKKPTKRKEGMLQKLQSAFEKILQKRISPDLRGLQNNVRSEADIADVVEQRIFQSMLKGDFENLPGKGKPLKIESNPLVDPSEEVIYRVLAKNGFAPEWIELKKEVKFKLHRWRLALQFAWNQRLDNCPVNELDAEEKWKKALEYFQVELDEINRKAPFGHQMFSYKMEKEVELVRNEHKRGQLKSPPKHGLDIFSKM